MRSQDLFEEEVGDDEREMAARLGVEPVELASDHAVFTLHPRELAQLLVS